MKFSIRDFAIGLFVGCLIGWGIAKYFEPAPFTARNERDAARQMEELIRREEARGKK